jgi:APA family basic amino acid/polyamine antiporter
VTAMIGTGVFTTSGLLLQAVGSRSAVLAVWAAGGVLAALGALCYSALARRFPESGGEYLFMSRTLHPAAGCVAGVLTVVVGMAAPCAAAALAFGDYLRPLLPAGWSPRMTASILLLAATGMHATSLSAAARLQIIAVASEVVLIVAFIVRYLAGGVGRLGAVGPVAGAVPTVSGLGLGLIWVSYSYTGWNTAVYVGGEVRDPERTLPRALIGGTLLVTALYLGLNAVFVLAVPPEVLAGRTEVGRLAAQAIGGPRLATAASAFIAYVLVTFVSCMTMAGPHIAARMAADGYLPRALAARPGQPPRRALLVQLALGLVPVWIAAFDQLLTYVSLALSLCTAATVIGLVRLRRREGAAAVPVMGWPWVPGTFLIFVLVSAGLTVKQRPLEAAVGLGTVLVGLATFRKRRLTDESSRLA